MTRKLAFAIRVFSVVALLLSSTLIVMAQNPVPFLSQPLVPDAIAPGVPGFTFTLTVNGTGFVPGSTVNWNGKPRFTTFVNRSRLIAYILSSDVAVPTTAWITVVNPGPGGGTSNMLYLPVNTPVSALSFQRTDYSVGGDPQFTTAADFTRSGKLDLAVANGSPGMIAILMGNGDGTFQGPQDQYAGSCSNKAIVGDFNRDGILDMAVPLYCSGQVAVMLGNGDGTFQPPVYYAAGGGAVDGITADFNGDGKLDLAILNQGSGTVSILLGNGDGTFQPHVDYAVGSLPTVVAAGDFNRDGKLDLTVSNDASDSVSILLGNGDGTFRPHADYPAGGGIGLTVADLNADGKLDIAVAAGPNVAVLLGNGDGTFRPYVNYPVSYAGKVAAGEMNDDGKLDLVFITWNSAGILLGSGDGTFQPPLYFPTGNGPYDALPADFNRDGRLDIATGNTWDGTASVLLQQPVAVQALTPHRK